MLEATRKGPVGGSQRPTNPRPRQRQGATASAGAHPLFSARNGLCRQADRGLIRNMRLLVDGAAKRPLGSTSLGTLNVLYLALLELGLEQAAAPAAGSRANPSIAPHPFTLRKQVCRPQANGRLCRLPAPPRCGPE